MGDILTPESGEIFEEPFDEALSKRYLAYALSTITQRALPDARDGLKPVHRRILHAMRVLKLNPRDAFKKSARVVGDVIGKFHPHGDQAVYDALVRLAQDFASRYPLVEGQGNFGNIDGDGAAAMRYTEARLTEAAELLLQDIDQGTVDFRETYDGSEEEPLVLPAAFPNLLANGATGIAVGMATSIPPHNAHELCRAARTLIANPDVSVAQMLRSVKGPDFPTGGICVEPKEAIREAYETGRGGFRLRARWEAEELGRGTWQIVVTEIPYQVQKSKLVERIAQLLDQKKLPLLEDVRDESAEDIRLVLVPKSKNVDPELLMAALFKMSDLETRISLNLNVLDPSGTPRVMSLKDVMRIWIDHRREVVVRRAETRLGKVEDRLEVLAGYIIVYADLDEVIRIIRFEDEPKMELMKRFDLSDRQAEAILNMRLRALRKLEELEIRKEETTLKDERSDLMALIASDEIQWARVDEEVARVEEKFGPNTELGARKTQFGDAGADVSEAVAEALIVKEPVLVVVSQKGWIRALKGHAHDISGITFKEGDAALFTVKCETVDKLILFGTDGKFYAIDTSKLPGGRGHGDPLRLHAGLPEDAAPLALFKHEPERELLIASRAGNGFRVREGDVFATKKGGKQALNVGEGEAIACVPVVGRKIAVSNSKKRLLIFDIEDLPQMNRGKGVRLMGGKGAELIDVATFDPDTGLEWIDGAGRRHVFADWQDWEGKRAQAGTARPRGFPKTGKFLPADPVAVARAMDSA